VTSAKRKNFAPSMLWTLPIALPGTQSPFMLLKYSALVLNLVSALMPLTEKMSRQAGIEIGIS